MSSPQEISLRPRLPSDIPPLTTLLAKVHALTSYPVEGPSSFTTRFAKPSLYTAVALLGPRVVGHFAIEPPSTLSADVRTRLSALGQLDTFAVLSLLFVEPDVQGVGVGKKLLEGAMEWGSREGRRMVLVVLEKDGVAIGMYEKRGWGRVMEYVFETEERGYRAFVYVAPPVVEDA